MYRTRGLFTILLLIAAAACVTGPEKEPKSKLNYLNGDHYKATNQIGGIPLTIERQQVNVTIEGEALIDRSELYQPALRFTELVLLKGSEELARVTTDNNGRFTFSHDLPNGTYRIKADTKDYVGDVKVVVVDYQVKNVMLKVRLAGASTGPAPESLRP